MTNSRPSIYEIRLRKEDSDNDIHIRKRLEGGFDVYTVNKEHTDREVTIEQTKQEVLEYLSDVLEEMVF